MFSKDGIEMMVINSLANDGCNLIVKGKMMRSMPATIYLRPEEMVKALKLLSWRVVLIIPVMIVKGLWLTLKNKEADEKKG